MSSTHQNQTLDYSNYIGREYLPVDFDCWGLVREVYQRELGVDLPAVPIFSGDLRAVIRTIKAHEIRGMFERCEPQHLCVAELYLRESPNHVGVYLATVDGPRILHNHSSSGVICEPLPSVTLRFNRIEYWRYAG